MLFSGENILELIPQRYPMVMIDALVSCDEKQTVTRLTLRDDNLFLDKYGISPAGLMENMAQTAAARTGYLLRNQNEGESKKIPVGVIGSIKNFRLYFRPSEGFELTTTITVEHEIMQAVVVKGKVEADGKLAAEADMQIFITEDQTEGS